LYAIGKPVLPQFILYGSRPLPYRIPQAEERANASQFLGNGSIEQAHPLLLRIFFGGSSGLQATEKTDEKTRGFSPGPFLAAEGVPAPEGGPNICP
jgi:hypothetical protein